MKCILGNENMGNVMVRVNNIGKMEPIMKDILKTIKSMAKV